MEEIEQLQQSSRRLKDLYSKLERNQSLIVSSAFGQGNDLSTPSLLKFAANAESFDGYANEYKTELTKFQKLLKSVQQKAKRQQLLSQQKQQQQQQQKQSSQQVNNNNISNRNTNNNNNNNPPLTQSLPKPSTKQNGSSMQQSTSSSPKNINNSYNNDIITNRPTKPPAQSSSVSTVPMNNNNNNINNSSSTVQTNITRKSASNQNQQQSSSSSYYSSQQTEYNTMPPQRQIRNSNTSNINQQQKSLQSRPPQSTQTQPQSSQIQPPPQQAPPKQNKPKTVSEPTFTRTYSEPQQKSNNNNVNMNNNTNINNNNTSNIINNNNDNNIDDIYTNDLIASSQIIHHTSDNQNLYQRRREIQEEERARKNRQESDAEIKARRRKKKRMKERQRKARKEAAGISSTSPPLTIDDSYNNNNNNNASPDRSYNDDHKLDIGFDVEDSKQIHNQQHQIQHSGEQQDSNKYKDLKTILKKKRGTYQYNNTGDIYDEKEIYTLTMLRFWGLPGLQSFKKDDKEHEKIVKDVVKREFKFKDEQIERVQIRDGRSWCIVWIRASMKYILDKLKKQKNKNEKIKQKNWEIRKMIKERDHNDDDDDENNKEIPKQQPLYQLAEYVRRDRDLDDQEESNQLYVLNFDVLNKNCHKAFTNLFLKFGDLRNSIKMGTTWKNDPWAIIDYKDINDAKKIWEYQNIDGNPKEKIQFGRRTLMIRYYDPYKRY